MNKTIEEKAKAYDEAVERAKRMFSKKEINYLFPELVESEGERIRKEILEVAETVVSCDGTLYGKKYNCREWIAWLEKQGEKPQGKTYTFEGKSVLEAIDNINKVEPKFKVGDWVVYCGKTCKITGLHNGIFTITNQDGSYFFNQVESTIEPIFHLWTIQDAKDGDVLVADSRPFIYNGSKNEVTVGAYCGFNVEHKFSFAHNYVINRNITPATKEQRDTLFAKMKEFGYEWDFEKKELMKIEDEEYNGEDYGIDSLFHAQRILEKTLGSVDGYETDDGILSHKCAITAVKKLYEQKSAAWSKEDGRMFDYALDMIEWYSGKNGDKSKLVSDWLKSIKDRVQPKQEWSKEDKERFISCLKRLGSGNPEQPETINSKWFKEHVFPQNTWKPNKEQLHLLHWIANIKLGDSVVEQEVSKHLNSLYDDLKKL